MPATKSRISASSSTIKISAAMVLLAYTILLFWLSGVGFAGGGNPHPHPGPPLARNFLGGIAQLDRAAVLFNNASHDSEPKSGALLAGRNVRLKQPAAIFLCKPMPLSMISITISSLSRAALTSIVPLPSSPGGTAAIASVALFTLL